MPIYKLPLGAEINLTGDPHLARAFRTGVPLHRLGDREEMVWQDFQQQLETSAEVTIILGDLFDKFVVPPEAVLRASEILLSASREKKLICILRGNHDASRDANKKSSFELLERLCWHDSKIIFVNDYKFLSVKNGGYLHLFGWQPFVSAADAVAEVAKGWDLSKLDPQSEIPVAFGHWDITQHGEDTHNLIPLEQLAGLGIKTVYTGHIHKAERFTRNGITVEVVGSMQPYAHGEEPPLSMLYLTLTPEQVEDMLNGDEDVLANTNVRVLLIDGAEYPREFNCLSKTYKRVHSGEAKVDEEGNPVAAYDTFDVRTMISTTLTEHKVSDALQARISTTLMEKLSHA